MLLGNTILKWVEPRIVLRLQPKRHLIVYVSSLIRNFKQQILKHFVLNEWAHHTFLQLGNRSVHFIQHKQMHCLLFERFFPERLRFLRVFVCNLMQFLSLDVFAIEDLFQKRDLTLAKINQVSQKNCEMHSQLIRIEIWLKFRQILQYKLPWNNSLEKSLQLLIKAYMINHVINNRLMTTIRIDPPILILATEKYLAQSNIL